MRLSLNVYDLCTNKGNAYLEYPKLRDAVEKLAKNPSIEFQLKENILLPRKASNKMAQFFQWLEKLIQSLIHNMKMCSKRYASNFRQAAFKIHQLLLESQKKDAQSPMSSPLSLQDKMITAPVDSIAKLRQEIENGEFFIQNINKNIAAVEEKYNANLAKKKKIEEDIADAEDNKPNPLILANEPLDVLKQSKETSEEALEALKKELTELQKKQYGWGLSIFQQSLNQEIEKKGTKAHVLENKLAGLEIQIEAAESTILAEKKVKGLNGKLPEVQNKIKHLSMEKEILKKNVERIEKVINAKKDELAKREGQAKFLEPHIELPHASLKQSSVAPQVPLLKMEAAQSTIPMPVLTPMGRLKQVLQEGKDPGKKVADLLLLGFQHFPEESVISFEQVGPAKYKIGFREPLFFKTLGEKKSVISFGNNSQKAMYISLSENSVKAEGLSAFCKIPVLGWKEPVAEKLTYLPKDDKFEISGKLSFKVGSVTKASKFEYEKALQNWKEVHVIAAKEVEQAKKDIQK